MRRRRRRWRENNKIVGEGIITLRRENIKIVVEGIKKLRANIKIVEEGNCQTGYTNHDCHKIKIELDIILYFPIAHNTLCLTPKFCINHCF